MKTKNMQYCPECHKNVYFTVSKEDEIASIKGIEYLYSAQIARCVHCNEALDVYSDENLKLAYDAYRVHHNLISLEKIHEIPEMYGIGKRALSLLLGWGEQTFTRYYDGYLPTKQYSDILKEIYDNPKRYHIILEEKKKCISKQTYIRSSAAIQKIFE